MHELNVPSFCNAPLFSEHPTRLAPAVLGLPRSQRLMWPLFVVVPHPAIDDGSRLTQRFKTMEPFQGPERSTPRARSVPVYMGRREFLSQAIDLHRAREVTTAENKPVIGTKGQRLPHALQRPESIDQRFPQRRLRGLAYAIQPPGKDLPRAGAANLARRSLPHLTWVRGRWPNAHQAGRQRTAGSRHVAGSPGAACARASF